MRNRLQEGEKKRIKMTRFNRTLTFEAAQRRDQLDAAERGGEKLSILQAKTLNNDLSSDNKQDSENETHSISGLSGVFITTKTDFNLKTQLQIGDNDLFDEEKLNKQHYEDEINWTNEKREKVRRFRFVVCLLALFGMSFALMSRLMLNVAVVDMVIKQTGELVDHEPVSIEAEVAEELLKNTTTATTTTNSTDEHLATMLSNDTAILLNSNITETTETTLVDMDQDLLKFDWSTSQVSMLLSSFYIGYMPGILFAGSLAERYGSMYPLFISAFGSALVNFLTPLTASYSINLLMALRVVLGLVQGCLFPTLYELFNKWLTPTEMSIFAPMIKVSMPFGSLLGTLIPGLFASLKLEWPMLFYTGGSFCLVWSIIWLCLASSTPQTNRFVRPNELQRIMRKKQPTTTTISTIQLRQQQKSIELKIQQQQQPQRQQEKLKQQKGIENIDIIDNKPSTPWLLIITNPSVLALTLVKFTYNIGCDFLFIMLPIYFKNAFLAETETISAVASTCFVVQGLLITFVGWLAKIVVTKRTYGLSVTKWRKIFQGSSNFLMAATYLTLMLLPPEMETSAICLLIVCIFWMLGAGGESMVPFDLSQKYPASIVGFAHSISISSGITIPGIVSLLVGDQKDSHESWNKVFLCIALLQIIGGLVFCFVLKAKPFLPEELQQQQQQEKQSQLNLRNNNDHNKS